ncbi:MULTISPECIES: hypothetical protein [Aminobacterium]|jgi:hypothetical protein|uniref:hypothetical protein n=1 Tax=Aminobacterium TaxID=81466 RepID=UPI002580CC0E|nr:hypothetical protein [Aminobacterium sp. UBA4834]
MAETVFRAFSKFDEWQGRKCACIVWVPLRAERIRIAPYPFLLQNYNVIPRHIASMAKGYADEFLGLDEFVLFKCFMKEKRGIFVESLEYELPLQWQDERGNPCIPLRCDPSWEKIFSVKGDEVINLPFEVDGYWHIL